MELTRAGSVSSDPEVSCVHPKPGPDSCIHTQACLGIGNCRRAGEGPVRAAPSPKEATSLSGKRNGGREREGTTKNNACYVSCQCCCH